MPGSLAEISSCDYWYDAEPASAGDRSKSPSPADPSPIPASASPSPAAASSGLAASDSEAKAELKVSIQRVQEELLGEGLCGQAGASSEQASPVPSDSNNDELPLFVSSDSHDEFPLPTVPPRGPRCLERGPHVAIVGEAEAERQPHPPASPPTRRVLQAGLQQQGSQPVPKARLRRSWQASLAAVPAPSEWSAGHTPILVSNVGSNLNLDELIAFASGAVGTPGCTGGTFIGYATARRLLVARPRQARLFFPSSRLADHAISALDGAVYKGCRLSADHDVWSGPLELERPRPRPKRRVQTKRERSASLSRPTQERRVRRKRS